MTLWRAALGGLVAVLLAAAIAVWALVALKSVTAPPPIPVAPLSPPAAGGDER